MAIFVHSIPYKTGNGYHKSDRFITTLPPPGTPYPTNVTPTPGSLSGGYGRKNGLYTKSTSRGRGPE